jgi:hypothetical protein
MESLPPKVPFYERGLFWGVASLVVAAVLAALGLILPPTTVAKWLLIFGCIFSVIPLWLVFDVFSYKAITYSLTFVCLVLVGFGMHCVLVKRHPLQAWMTVRVRELVPKVFFL